MSQTKCPRRCPNCGHSAFAEADLYLGDYHSSPADDDFLERWQCVRCCSIWRRGPHKLLFDGCEPITLRPFRIDDWKSGAMR